MKVDIYMKGRDYKAFGTYDDGRVTIHCGSTLHNYTSNQKELIKGAYRTRNDKQYVQNGIVVKQCTFDSPSAAAEFITGISVNGLQKWKIKRGYSLGAYLKEHCD